jgi:beta-lactamase regulating signal transducer with metallopeptidase domain
MTAWMEPFAFWLADVYLAATILLLATAAIFALVKQPALRMSIAWGIVPGLLLVACWCLSSSRPHLGLWPAPCVETKPTEIPSAVSPVPAPVIVTEPEAERDRMASDRFEPRPITVQAAAPIMSPPTVSAVNEPGRHAWSARLLAGFVWTFLAGSLFVASWLVLGVWRASRLVRESEPAPQACLDELQALIGAPSRSPRLRVNRRLLTPVATGAIAPAILLPAESSRAGSGHELRAVLAHEWTHIKNGDLWLLALDRIVLSLLWAHPFYWWTRRRFRADQEFLADAAAAAQIGAADYAALLVHWARKVTEQRSLTALTAVGIWERPAGLTERVMTLLADSNREIVRTSGRARVAVAAVLALLSLAAATISLRPPQIVLAQAQMARVEDKSDAVSGLTVAPPAPAIPIVQSAAVNESPRSESAQNTPNSNDVQGTCRDKQGKPLAGVQVFLYAIQKASGREQLLRQGTTEADGRFHFRDCFGKKVVQMSWQLMDEDGAVFEVFARRADLGTGVKAVQGRGQELDFTLTKAASLTGTVRDRQGRPIAGALVHDMYWPLPKAGWLSARSDAKGNFTISDLSEYQYAGPKGSGPPLGLLSVEHPEYGSAEASYNRVPGHVDVVLGKRATIEGTVLYGETGKPAAGVYVFANWIDQPVPFVAVDLPSAKTDKNGHYRIRPLPQGLFNIYASVEPFDRLASFEKSDNKLVASTIEAFRAEEGRTAAAPPIRLVKGGVVKGRLYQYRPGVNGVHDPVKFKEGEKLEIIVFRGPSLPAPGVVADMAIARPNGTFELRLPPGLHYLQLTNYQKPDGTWRLPYSDMGEPCTEEDAAPPQMSGLHRIKIREGQTTEIEISVFRPSPQKKADDKKTQNDKPASSAAAVAQLPTVSPKIVDYHLEKDAVGGLCLGRDEDRVAGVEVALYIIGLRDDSHAFVGRTITNDEGQFVFRPVPNLKSRDELYLFVARKKGLGTSEGTLRQRHDWIDLRVGAGVPLNGVVHDEEGKPIAGALIRGRSYWSYAVPDESPSVRTNERGEFQIDGLPRFGACSVSHPDYLSEGFGDAKKNPVVATLQKASVVQGQVIDGETGQPVAGAVVTLQRLGHVEEEFEPRGGKHGRPLVTTDSKGRYQVRSLGPGTLNLSFRGGPAGVASGIIETLKVGRGQTVEVPPVRLAKGAIVAVRLIDNDAGRLVDMEANETVVIGIRSGEASASADAKLRLEALHMRHDGTIGVWLPAGKHTLSLSGGPYFSIGDVQQGMGHDLREVKIKGGEAPTVEFRVVRITPTPVRGGSRVLPGA